MKSLFRRCLLCCLFLLVSCSARTSQEVIADLWSGWEKMEVLMEADFPKAIPLILVHGWNGGESTWPAPERLIELEKQLQRDIYLFTYRTALFPNKFPPLEVLEEQLDRYMAAYEQVDIIAHSMGGLLVRHYLSHHSESPIRRVVFLGTPHFGTAAAQVLMRLGSTMPEGNIQANEIQPGSGFLWQLNALKGSELDSVEVLNVYISEGPLAKTDFIVSAASSHLPWAFNATVAGKHHTLGERIMEYPFVFDFLRTGALPSSPAALPKRKDAWLRFKVGGKYARLAENNFKAFNERGLPERGFSLCCKLRSGLYDEAGFKTVVIDGVEAGMKYEFRPYAGGAPVVVMAEELISAEQPVVMKEIIVDGPQQPAPVQAEGTP